MCSLTCNKKKINISRNSVRMIIEATMFKTKLCLSSILILVKVYIAAVYGTRLEKK